MADTLAANGESAGMRRFWWGLAALATLAGAWLCWKAPQHRMSVEESAKDRRLTEDVARRQLRVRACLGPTLVIGGTLVLGWVLVGP